MEKEQLEKLGRYRHFKGNEYELVDFAKCSETMEDYVIYKPLYGEGNSWIRPAKMFFETIERDGNRFKRFEPI